MRQSNGEHVQRGKAPLFGLVGLVFMGMLALPFSGSSHELPGNEAESHAAHRQTEDILEIVMTDGQYRIVHGNQELKSHEVQLQAGQDIMFVIQNRGTVAHELITPLFMRTEVHFSGDATGIFGKEAAGFRIAPGKDLRVWLKVPSPKPFKTMYDVAWCNTHESTVPAEANLSQREMLLIATQAPRGHR